jgi:toxin ParE1/3/4
MRTVVWSAKSKGEADSQFEYLESHSLQGLQLVRARLFDAVEKLAIMPIGRPGRVPGIFEKVVHKTSLIIVYELPNDSVIHILRILHSSMDNDDDASSSFQA